MYAGFRIRSLVWRRYSFVSLGMALFTADKPSSMFMFSVDLGIMFVMKFFIPSCIDCVACVDPSVVIVILIN